MKSIDSMKWNEDTRVRDMHVAVGAADGFLHAYVLSSLSLFKRLMPLTFAPHVLCKVYEIMRMHGSKDNEACM